MSRTPADRQRAYRQRQARRIASYPVQVSQRIMEQVIETRGLSDEHAASNAHLQLHLSLIIEEWVSLHRKKNRDA